MADWPPGGRSFSISDPASSSARLERAYRRLAELTLLLTCVLSTGSIQNAARAATIRALGPHATAALTRRVLADVAGGVSTEITIDVVVMLVAIAVWLLLAWANGKGSPLARVGAIIAAVFNATFSIGGLVNGDATYAPAAMIVSGAVMVIGIAAAVLLVARSSWPYFTRPANAT